jgi:hypothetical protein
MFARLATALGIIALCALSILRVARPPAPVPATAPDTVFSAERAVRHVEEIAVRPHPMGTADHDRVRDYIITQLTNLGLRPQLQTTTAIGTRYQEAGHVQNILAWMPGSDAKGKAVLLVVHYDGVEAGPAASDDAAGCAALLETLRALRSRPQPLTHDVIALFTDGEEAGLLGAAAFAREHPWAKDAAIVLNFEARGTTGRSYMFETGPGNQDAVSALRHAGDVTAGSTFTTIYRSLPNDTDLSELAVLGLPALNFAFADGVERYHTSRDDVAHLNRGSLQHHGLQMLALTKTLASGVLPRPKTGDAVFFDLPAIGLVIYPEWMARVLAVLALVLTVIVVAPMRGGILVGAGAMLIGVVLSGVVARFVNPHGPAMWSGVYATALALLVLAINAVVYAAASRRRPDLESGVLVVWLLLVLVTSFAVPGVSYIFTWPLLFALVASRSRNMIAAWIAAAVTLLLLAGFAFASTVIMLGAAGVGAVALAVFTSLIAWLLAPMLGSIAVSARWAGAPWLAGAAVVVALVGVLVVHQSADHPIRTSLAYAQSADDSSAWLGAFGGNDDWTRAVIGSSARAPEWTSALTGGGTRLTGRQVSRVPMEAPSATLVRDTIIGSARRIVLRVKAPHGTTGLVMHARGAPVLTSSIDDRVVDTTRYRRSTPLWTMQYWSVPDSGAIIALSIPQGRQIDFELAARRPGLPAIAGVSIPARPADVVPSQSGDVSYVYRRMRF